MREERRTPASRRHSMARRTHLSRICLGLFGWFISFSGGIHISHRDLFHRKKKIIAHCHDIHRIYRFGNVDQCVTTSKMILRRGRSISVKAKFYSRKSPSPPASEIAACPRVRRGQPSSNARTHALRERYEPRCRRLYASWGTGRYS